MDVHRLILPVAERAPDRCPMIGFDGPCLEPPTHSACLWLVGEPYFPAAVFASQLDTLCDEHAALMSAEDGLPPSAFDPGQVWPDEQVPTAAADLQLVRLCLAVHASSSFAVGHPKKCACPGGRA